MNIVTSGNPKVIAMVVCAFWVVGSWRVNSYTSSLRTTVCSLSQTHDSSAQRVFTQLLRAGYRSPQRVSSFCLLRVQLARGPSHSGHPGRHPGPQATPLTTRQVASDMLHLADAAALDELPHSERLRPEVRRVVPRAGSKSGSRITILQTNSRKLPLPSGFDFHGKRKGSAPCFLLVEFKGIGTLTQKKVEQRKQPIGQQSPRRPPRMGASLPKECGSFRR